mmetsp:Transcript_10812/g.34140  ORF Transcript_10812/g.34140 Transcript_10812/m.34140 type:complete len:215 (+) Transcript_10812:612-1256(+)
MMADERRKRRRPHLSASAPERLQPTSAPTQKSETQSAHALSAAAPAAPVPPAGMPSATRCTPACVFMFPLLYPNEKDESSATPTVRRSAGVKPAPSSRYSSAPSASAYDAAASRAAFDAPESRSARRRWDEVREEVNAPIEESDVCVATRDVRPGCAMYAKSASGELRSKRTTCGATRMSVIVARRSFASRPRLMPASESDWRRSSMPSADATL